MQPDAERHDHLNQTSIRRLSECLRTEMCAAETYELALRHIDHQGLRRPLEGILTSHAHRVDTIREWMWTSDVESIASFGAWGALAKFIQVGADLLGDRAAIGALEEGEQRGRKLYDMQVEGLDFSVESLIRTHLRPEQKRTHEACKSLRTYVKRVHTIPQ